MVYIIMSRFFYLNETTFSIFSITVAKWLR